MSGEPYSIYEISTDETIDLDDEKDIKKGNNSEITNNKVDEDHDAHVDRRYLLQRRSDKELDRQGKDSPKNINENNTNNTKHNETGLETSRINTSDLIDTLFTTLRARIGICFSKIWITNAVNWLLSGDLPKEDDWKKKSTDEHIAILANLCYQLMLLGDIRSDEQNSPLSKENESFIPTNPKVTALKSEDLVEMAATAGKYTQEENTREILFYSSNAENSNNKMGIYADPSVFISPYSTYLECIEFMYPSYNSLINIPANTLYDFDEYGMPEYIYPRNPYVFQIVHSQFVSDSFMSGDNTVKLPNFMLLTVTSGSGFTGRMAINTRNDTIIGRHTDSRPMPAKFFLPGAKLIVWKMKFNIQRKFWGNQQTNTGNGSKMANKFFALFGSRDSKKEVLNNSEYLFTLECSIDDIMFLGSCVENSCEKFMEINKEVVQLIKKNRLDKKVVSALKSTEKIIKMGEDSVESENMKALKAYNSLRSLANDVEQTYARDNDEGGVSEQSNQIQTTIDNVCKRALKWRSDNNIF